MGLRRRLSKKWNELVDGTLTGPGVDVDSVNTEGLSSTFEFALGDSDSAGINEAINRLPGGGTVIAQRGSQPLSEQVLLPDGVTLYLPAGCELYPASDFTAQNKPTVNGLDIVSVVTNMDHSGGNSNVSVSGDGRIHDNNDNLDPNDTLAGVMWYLCDNSSVEGVEVDHIAEGISQEGGPAGDNRFFAVLLLQCEDSSIDSVYGHDTGDDTLGIRRSSTDCEVVNCRSHGAQFGHAIQSSSANALGSPNGPNTDISVRDCNCGPVAGTSRFESGVAFHNTVGGEIKGCDIAGTGSGVLLLGDTADVDIDCRVTDPDVYGYYFQGVKSIKAEGHIKLTQDIEFDAVFIDDFGGDSRDIDIDVTVNSEATRDRSVAQTRGVTANPINGNTIEDLSIDINATGLSEQAIDLLGTTSGTLIRNVSVRLTANECGRGVRFIETDGSISDCVVQGGTIREAGETIYGVGVLFSGVTDCVCGDVRANVSGTAFLEESGADYNLFDNVNGRGSGTAAPQTVGSNTKVGDVQP